MKCELLEILPIGWPHKYPTSISVDVFKRVTTNIRRRANPC